MKINKVQDKFYAPQLKLAKIGDRKSIINTKIEGRYYPPEFAEEMGLPINFIRYLVNKGT